MTLIAEVNATEPATGPARQPVFPPPSTAAVAGIDLVANRAAPRDDALGKDYRIGEWYATDIRMVLAVGALGSLLVEDTAQPGELVRPGDVIGRFACGNEVILVRSRWSGTIGGIFARAGDRVRAGERIAWLTETRSDATGDRRNENNLVVEAVDTVAAGQRPVEHVIDLRVG
jgi:biotin carboxyl carrier protein